MKKCIILSLVILLALSGCDFPINTNAPGKTIPSEKILSEQETGIKPAAKTAAQPETKPVNETQAAIPDEKSPAVQPAAGEPSQTTPVTLYYQTSDGFIVPATRRIAKQEGIARAAINGLTDNAINRESLEYYGLYPVLPEGTDILGLTIKNGTAIIDFNTKLLNYENEASERNIIAAVVYTLTEFRTVKEVKMLINGVPVRKMKFASDIPSLLSRDNILVNAGRLNMKAGSAGKLDLYVFKNVNEEQYLLPLSSEVTREELGELPGKLVKMLGDGFRDDKFYSELPRETRLIKSGIKGSTLTLDFNKALISYGGGTAREDGILRQILHSAKQIKGVDRVKILIDGEIPELPEGSDVSEELAIPQVINDLIDK